MALLAELGLLPQLDVDSLHQRRLQRGQHYQLSAELGFVPSGDGSGLLGESWLRIGQARGVAAQARAVVALSDRAQLKAMLRGVLRYHLGRAPLRSRAVLHQAHDILSVSSP